MSKGGAMGCVPIMAHPPATTRPHLQGVPRPLRKRRHATSSSTSELGPLPRAAARSEVAQAACQRQGFNADVLPGPNARALPSALEHFVPPAGACPARPLSPGWRLGILGPDDAYSDVDATQMIRMCREHGLEGEELARRFGPPF